jgi:hypothetical protein
MKVSEEPAASIFREKMTSDTQDRMKDPLKNW